ncbi:hypothetical protein JW926_13410 [Candidatus Sumerlaeota bacterium]|nr:hypothetical protein [Candidatus Sumerlaeota bacterium]
MKSLFFAFLCINLFFLSGCSFNFRAPVVPPTAAVFTNIEAPIDIEFNDTTIGKKKGEAKSVGILSLFSFGDASVKAAAENGNISVIDHVGYRFTNILGIVTIYKTLAYGQ